VKINAIRQKDGNSIQTAQDLVRNLLLSSLVFNLEKKKDVNRLEIKDRDGDKISFLNLCIWNTHVIAIVNFCDMYKSPDISITYTAIVISRITTDESVIDNP